MAWSTASRGRRTRARWASAWVHQHFKLVQPFTIAENVMLANPQTSWRKGIAAVSEGIARLSDELGFEIDPSSRIDRISVAEQQRVEIIKVLMGGARLLILDEPTSVLTDEEAARLLRTIQALARRGTCVILITHKLREVLAHADRVTVMRGGRTVATVDAGGTNAADPRPHDGGRCAGRRHRTRAKWPCAA